MAKWRMLFVPVRRLCLRLALGGRTYNYMIGSVQADPRTRTARWVDIVVRKDGIEERTEADWVKAIAALVEGQPRADGRWPDWPRWESRWWSFRNRLGRVATVAEVAGVAETEKG